jgi:hypothetical protein
LQLSSRELIKESSHKSINFNMPSAQYKASSLPIEPASAMHITSKNTRTKIWDIPGGFPFQTGSTVKDHWILLTELSAGKIKF